MAPFSDIAGHPSPHPTGKTAHILASASGVAEEGEIDDGGPLFPDSPRPPPKTRRMFATLWPQAGRRGRGTRPRRNETGRIVHTAGPARPPATPCGRKRCAPVRPGHPNARESDSRRRPGGLRDDPRELRSSPRSLRSRRRGLRDSRSDLRSRRSDLRSRPSGLRSRPNNLRSRRSVLRNHRSVLRNRRSNLRSRRADLRRRRAKLRSRRQTCSRGR